MSGTTTFCFPRQERLKKRPEIQNVFKKGRHVSSNGAKLFLWENAQEHNRIAFTFARKFGNAVERNHARRLGRESYRHLRGSLKRGYDLVVLLYPQEIDFQGRLKQLSTLFSRSGLV